MPTYTIHLDIDDLLGQFFTGGLPIPHGFVFDTGFPFTITSGSATTSDPSDVNFPGLTPGSAVSAWVGGAGDLFRSGPIVLPNSSTPLTIITLPTATGTVAELNSDISSQGVFSIPISSNAQLVAAVASLGLVQPESATITSVKLVATPPSLGVTVTGTVTMQEAFFVTNSYSFTFTATLSVAPSRDPNNTSRILSLTGSNPSFVCQPLPAALTNLLAPFVLQQAAPQFEATLNAFVANVLTSGLKSQGYALTSTATVSAWSVAVSGATTTTVNRRPIQLPPSISLQLLISDLFQGGLTQLLSVNYSPNPKFGVRQTYTITVMNAATGAPISGAKVSVTNPKTTFFQGTTNNQGTVSAPMTLTDTVTYTNPKLGVVTDVYPPQLIVSAVGFPGYFQTSLT